MLIFIFSAWAVYALAIFTLPFILTTLLLPRITTMLRIRRAQKGTVCVFVVDVLRESPVIFTVGYGRFAAVWCNTTLRKGVTANQFRALVLHECGHIAHRHTLKCALLNAALIGLFMPARNELWEREADEYALKYLRNYDHLYTALARMHALRSSPVTSRAELARMAYLRSLCSSTVPQPQGQL